MAALAVVVMLPTGTGVLVWRDLIPQSSAPPAEVPSAETPVFPFPDKPSIVVLPFDNLSGDPAQDYFSNDITEVLTSDLSRISGLFIIARNTAFSIGKSRDVQFEKATELDPQYAEAYVYLGYFKLTAFAQIVAAHAYFLSRLNHQTTSYY